MAQETVMDVSHVAILSLLEVTDMQNITVALDEQTLTYGQGYARQRKMTLNQLLRDLLVKTVHPTTPQWWQETMALMEQSAGDSQGQTWTREELHRG
jgi:hypothetical protein